MQTRNLVIPPEVNGPASNSIRDWLSCDFIHAEGTKYQAYCDLLINCVMNLAHEGNAVKLDSGGYAYVTQEDVLLIAFEEHPNGTRHCRLGVYVGSNENLKSVLDIEWGADGRKVFEKHIKCNVWLSRLISVAQAHGYC